MHLNVIYLLYGLESFLQLAQPAEVHKEKVRLKCCGSHVPRYAINILSLSSRSNLLHETHSGSLPKHFKQAKQVLQTPRGSQTNSAVCK